MKAPSPFTLFPKQLVQHLDSIYWNYQNSNFSYTELSHRSKYYADLNVATMNHIRTFLKVSEDIQIIFVGVGQTYAALPFNLLKITDGNAVYIVNGQQSMKNYQEGSKHGQNVLKISSLQERQTYVKHFQKQGQKFYICYNYKQLYQAGQDVQELQKHSENQILICDLSYCANIKTVDVSKHGIVHFRSGTGIGMLGTQVLIVRKDLISKHSANCPDVLEFEFAVRMKSIINTPSTLSTLVLKQNIQYLLKSKKDHNLINQVLDKIKQAKIKQLQQLEEIQIVYCKKQLSNNIKFRVKSKEIYSEDDWVEYFRFNRHLNCWEIFLQEENENFALKTLFLKANR